jgi:transcriptional regulator with XRE-family HTH domain
MTISQRIFGIMEKKHLKQSDLANFLGISNSSVSDWKKKGSVPSADKIVKISEFLNVSVDYLLGRTDEPNSTQQTNSSDVHNNKNSNISVNQNNNSAIVCGTDSQSVWIITAYVPNPNLWSSDFKTRKEH